MRLVWWVAVVAVVCARDALAMPPSALSSKGDANAGKSLPTKPWAMSIFDDANGALSETKKRKAGEEITVVLGEKRVPNRQHNPNGDTRYTPAWRARKDGPLGELRSNDVGYNVRQMGEHVIAPPFDDRSEIITPVRSYAELSSDNRVGWLGKKKALSICKNEETGEMVTCSSKDLDESAPSPPTLLDAIFNKIIV